MAPSGLSKSFVCQRVPVSLHRFGPVLLDDRHVLQRCGVENEIRLEIGEKPKDARALANIGYPPGDGAITGIDSQFLGDGVKIRLGIVEDQKACGAVADYPPADLRADRSAAAGDDNRLAGGGLVAGPVAIRRDRL